MTDSIVPTRVRVRRLRAYEPPYDDELEALGLSPFPPQREQLPFEEPPRPAAPPPVERRPDPPARGTLPDPRPWANRYLRAVLEALVSARPSRQLVRWSTPAVVQQIVSTGRSPRWATHAGGNPTVNSLRCAEPTGGVAEIAAVAQRGDRIFAVAARLEDIDGRWQCTELRIG